MRKFLLSIAVVLIAFAVAPTVASAGQNEGVCAGTHIQPPNGTTKSITVTAPEGKLISAYCVKAGSIKQGNGPVYVTVNPPTNTVTISHPSGKDISHYTVTFVNAPDKPEEPRVPEVPETPETPDAGLIPPLNVERPAPTLTELPRTGAGELIALAAIGISLIGFGTLTVRASRSK